MTIDQPVATRLEGRSLAWRLDASATIAIAVVLHTWALTVDFTKVSYGFFSDGATYYSLAHSLAEDFDFEYRRDDLVRVWREYPSGPEGSGASRKPSNSTNAAITTAMLKTAARMGFGFSAMTQSAMSSATIVMMKPSLV